MYKRLIAWVMMMVVVAGLVVPTSVFADSPQVVVTVTDDSSCPIVGASVFLWNHSSDPSELAGRLITDTRGEARFPLPDMKGPQDLLTQHLSVSVHADGYESFVLDWTFDRKQTISHGTEKLVLLDISPPDRQSVHIALDRQLSAPNSSADDVPEAVQPLGEIRERLVYSSVQADQLTDVANLHQVGSMQAKFRYGNTVTNWHGVGVKWESQDSFSVNTTIKVGKTTTSSLFWELPATTSDTAYKTRVCSTYFDYKVEEYYVEEFKDRGDGMLDWVKIDSYMKAYCIGLSPNATSAGTKILTASAPSGITFNRDHAPLSGTEWSKITQENIKAATTFHVSGIPVTLSLDHGSGTTEEWVFYNSSSTKFYEGGKSSTGVWRVRLK